MKGGNLLIASFALFSSVVFYPHHQVSAEQNDVPPSLFLEQADIFPVGVWLQDPMNASRYKAIGINFFAGLWDGPTERQLSELQAARMAVFAPQNDLALTGVYDDIIAGWMLPDEPDNAQYQAGGGLGPPISPDYLQQLYHEMKNRDPVRPVLLNLGQGVAWDHWHGRGTRTNHPEDYEEYVRAADILSFDIYPVTHRDSSIRGRLDYVARGVDRLIEWSGGTKPVWSVIEASRVSNPDIQPTGDQVRNLVWLSIIHGAKGIIYFVHEFAPVFVEASLLENSKLRDAVARINRRLQNLATVLKSEDLKGTIEIKSLIKPHNSVSALIREDACHLYVFAGSVSKFPTEVAFRIARTDVSGRIDVLDEQRNLSLKGNEFQDRFGPYATHLYKMPKDIPGCN